MREHRFIRSTLLVAVIGLGLAVSSCSSAQNAPTATTTTSQPTRATQPTSEWRVPPPTEPASSIPSSATLTPEAPSTESTPTPAPPGPSTDKPGLVRANAYWRRPDALTVDKSDQIGLGIQSAPLTEQINAGMQAIPGESQPAGQVKVSRHATAYLRAGSDDDVEINPKPPVDNSTESNIDLYWVWIVRPKRPTYDLLWRRTGDLILTAYVVIHVEGGQINDITTPITLRIPVKRTFPYTAGEVATSWKTWTGGTIGAAAVAVLFKRRKRGKEDPTADEEPRTQPNAENGVADAEP